MQITNEEWIKTRISEVYIKTEVASARGSERSTKHRTKPFLTLRSEAMKFGGRSDDILFVPGAELQIFQDWNRATKFLRPERSKQKLTQNGVL